MLDDNFSIDLDRLKSEKSFLDDVTANISNLVLQLFLM